MYYYTQLLHYLYVTGWDFAILKAQIKTHNRGSVELITRHYYFDKAELTADMKYLAEKEQAFWECVKSGRRPPRILPDIERR